MWAKLLTTILYDLAFKAYQGLIGYLKRKKRIKESQEVAKEIENENDGNDLRDSIDNLP